MNIWNQHGLDTPAEIKPDFERFKRAITSREAGPVPLGDLFADARTMSAFLGERVPNFAALRESVRGKEKDSQSDAIAAGIKFFQMSIDFYASVGWDFVTAHNMLGFPGFKFTAPSADSKEIDGGKRVYVDNEAGPIMSWEDFEKYAWPESPGTINGPSKVITAMLPEGMKVMALPGGLFEWTTWLMGMVPFSYALFDQPDLVDAVVNKISEIILTAAEEYLTLPNVGGFFIGDDMGFFSGTLIAPKIIREKFIPHLKKMVDLAHKHEKLALLHSCGNLTAIMDDLCDTGIDGKHSFEDKIMPVEDAYSRWGDRIGLIGGVDVNLLTSGTTDEIRARTRAILDACGPTGHYVLGTGNSVASYIPIQNYLTMLDEGRKWNKSNFGSEL